MLVHDKTTQLLGVCINGHSYQVPLEIAIFQSGKESMVGKPTGICFTRQPHNRNVWSVAEDSNIGLWFEEDLCLEHASGGNEILPL